MLTDILIEALSLIHVILDLLDVRVDIMKLNAAAHLPGSQVPGHELIHGPVLLLLVLQVDTDNTVLIPVGQHHPVVLPVDVVVPQRQGEEGQEAKDCVEHISEVWRNVCISNSQPNFTLVSGVVLKTVKNSHLSFSL